MLFYDFLFTAYKDAWTLLVYTSVPLDKIEQLVRRCVNKHLSTDRRLKLRIYRNFLGRKSSGQSKQLVPPCFGFVKHLFWCLNLR